MLTALRLTTTVSLCLLATACFSGCGGESGPDLGSVTGKVTLDDKPLAGAQVTFLIAGGRGASATTDEEGYYELGFAGARTGALPGKYKVLISTFQEAMEAAEEGETGSSRKPETIPKKYNMETTLTAEVKADEDNEFDFALKSDGEIVQPDADIDDAGDE